MADEMNHASLRNLQLQRGHEMGAEPHGVVYAAQKEARLVACQQNVDFRKIDVGPQ
jgi:hypothetical protein